MTLSDEIINLTKKLSYFRSKIEKDDRAVSEMETDLVKLCKEEIRSV